MMKGFVANKPRFFKLILETTISSSKQLMLPRTFVQNHYLKPSSPNPTTATLTLPNGFKWKVDVIVNTTSTTNGPQVWFQGEGWDKFVKSHSLEHGHFIVFQYEGSSNFSVLLFHISGSECCYNVPMPTKKKPEEPKTKEDAHQFEDRNDDDVSVEEIIPNMEMSAKCATVKANKKDKGSSSSGGFRETKRVEEDEEDDDDVSVEEILPEFGSLYKSAKRSRNTEPPICSELTVVIKEAHIKRHRLNIPRAFARGLMLKEQTLKLELAAANNSNKQQQYWPVKACKVVSKKSEMYLCGGWSKFLRDNSLRDGDVCKFEIIGFGTPMVIQVSIPNKGAK